MAIDGWGIDDRYQDAAGEWQHFEPETLAAVRGSMDSENSPPADSGNLQIIKQGTEARVAAGTLILEDGTELKIDRRGRLSRDLPIGYHDLAPADESKPTVRLIVTPGECRLPPDGSWGWSAQLYATRSSESWGFGDLADLRRLAMWAASHGAGVVLVNPLSAAAPVVPQQASPYYPSSRRFLNPLYLRVEEVPGASESATELQTVAAAGRALNSQRVIDRDAVFKLKMQALETIWRRVAPCQAMDRFRAQQGAPLEQFATYCLLAEQFGGDWRRWPTEYKSAEGEAVRQFAKERRDRFRFHQWLQWLLDEQLSRAAKAVAIVQDLAIGVDPGGFDAWTWQDLFAQQCSVGAPPDLYNRAGQNWGLPPFIPHKLRAARYEPFVQSLRAMLRHAGGLRIDHVMGLFRLYWIPEGFDPARGAFVRYRGDELLAVVAIESQRAGAFVVGEDLGTVEEEVRQALAAHRVLSYRLFWFEDEPPAAYPKLSMAAVSTHDLPTVAGLWSGHDLSAQKILGLNPNEEAIGEIHGKLASLAHLDSRARMDHVIEQTYRLLADADSLIATASLDDALAVTERPNMPCTTASQWPNWSLALPGGLDAVEQSPLARNIATRMAKRGDRQRRPEKAGSRVVVSG